MPATPPQLELTDGIAETKDSEPLIFVSINRYEEKKNIQLAIEAYCGLKETLPATLFWRTRLVIAGGYDSRVRENIHVYQSLRARAKVRSGNDWKDWKKAHFFFVVVVLINR